MIAAGIENGILKLIVIGPAAPVPVTVSRATLKSVTEIAFVNIPVFVIGVVLPICILRV